MAPMRRRRFLLATPPALAGALLLGRAAPAKATLAEALDLDTLVARADDIVVAQATGHGSRWQGRRIVTDVTLRVLDALEGGLAPGASPGLSSTSVREHTLRDSERSRAVAHSCV